MKRKPSSEPPQLGKTNIAYPTYRLSLHATALVWRKRVHWLERKCSERKNNACPMCHPSCSVNSLWKIQAQVRAKVQLKLWYAKKNIAYRASHLSYSEALKNLRKIGVEIRTRFAIG